MKRQIQASALSTHHKLESLLLKKLSEGFVYSKSLSTHASCVNAIAFSKPNGRWVASAGDDTNLFLWDTFHEFFCEHPTPVARFEVASRKNILALAFNASGDRIYSVGTGARLVQYDIARSLSDRSHTTTGCSLETAQLGGGVRFQHSRGYESTIYSVSAHPTQPNLVITADDEGLVRLHDFRSPGVGVLPSMESLLVRNSEINDAQWCPAAGASHSFVVAQADGNVCLMDSRMAFSTSIDPVQDPRHVVQRYATWISKPGSASCCAPEPSSVAFSSDGMCMALTLKNYVPVIYDTFDVFPLAQCSAPAESSRGAIPQNGRSYENSCTVKHGSFGGAGMGLPEDSVYCAGSDDFRAYAWVIPPREELKLARRCYARDQWPTQIEGNEIGFTTLDESQVVATPDNLSEPAFRLGGHKSVVNTAAFHPSLPLIFTSGVESHVLMHSTNPIPGGQLSDPPERTRTLPPSSRLSRISYRAAAYGLDGMSAEDISTYGRIPREERTVLMFDEYVRLFQVPLVLNLFS
ncbi:WD40 repeat-like protein [Ceratobasidium sp. AG-I]|nr:WD40 repeat-like protein [Ceratobasidium sp. AG-I]